MLKRLLGCLALTGLSLAAVAPAHAAAELPTYVGGRAVVHAAEAGRTYTYAWPGVYFESRFSGATVEVRVDDDQNDLNVYVDGVRKLTLRRPGRLSVSLGDLGPGDHLVRLEKLSETQSATGTFLGFFAPSQAEALAAPTYRRRIEFIGDSYTVGYGDTSRGQTCTTDDVRETTDTSRAFASLTAKHFGAAYRILASSGYGMVRNYADKEPGVTLPVLYRYALFDGRTPAEDDGWTPDVVVIGLGTNDFSTPLSQASAWKTRDDLRRAFQARYVAFVRELHAKWPKTHFILMASTNFDHEVLTAVEATAAELKRTGAEDLEVLAVSNLDYQGCHAHPSLEDENLLSKMLSDRISRLAGFE